jgi:NADH-quinone oxidoreductase subunit H
MIGGNVWLDAFVRLAAVLGLIILVVLVLTYVERKFIGRVQMRLGPMRTGPYGLLQSIADTIKLLTKEDLRPASADRWVFELAPVATFAPAFAVLVALPFTDSWGVRVLDLGLFYVVAVSALTVLGYIMAGWASDNKYALIGAMRSAAQLISYEIPMVLALLALAMVAGSLNLVQIVEEQGRVPFIVWQPLGFFLFMAGMLAETSRRPFDIPSAESEIVGGPWIEYSGIRWSIIFAFTEYASMFGLSVFGALIFLGGWNWPLGLELGWWWQLVLIFVKTTFLIMVTLWISATFPRLRIDQLMAFCWKILLPVAFLQILLNGLLLVYEWPDWTLLLTSGGALVFTAFLIYDATRLRQPVRAPARGVTS